MNAPLLPIVSLQQYQQCYKGTDWHYDPKKTPEMLLLLAHCSQTWPDNRKTKGFSPPLNQVSQ
jgi:hypothetical protein